MTKVFVDCDIILDLLTERKPFYNYAAEFFSLIDSKKISGYTSPVVIANLYYVLTKLKEKNFARQQLYRIRSLLDILQINQKIIDLALASSIKDFEDAIQFYTAEQNNVELIITRNTVDYPAKPLMILTAEEFLTFFYTKL